MRALRLLLCVATTALSLAVGCGPDPEGVEDCRAIESARCRAAEACGVIDDAESCERFYRDHCLHGLSVNAPGRPLVEACVEAIEAAPDADDCDAVLEPERFSACSFLDPSEEPRPDTSEGGAGGAPSSEPMGGAPSSEPMGGAPSSEPMGGAGGTDAGASE